MDARRLCERLDAELSIEDFADVDASANGLQIGTDSGTVERVALAVDGVEKTIEAAAEWDADLLVVHHGLSWGGIERVTGRTYGRIAALMAHDIDLYAAHLPLDGHPTLGNAAGVASVLGLEDRRPFGELGPVTIGQRGRLPGPTRAVEIQQTLDAALDHDGTGIDVLEFGPERIESVAVVTGSGTDWLDEAAAVDADAFVTGEAEGKLYHMARESEMTVFLGGHYATETFGVRSLAELIGSWGPQTHFVEAPTGL